MENKATTCKVEGSDITIMLKIAFSGADNSYIDRVKNEIETVWNGSNGYQTCGRYRVKFKVETMMKITDLANVNCEPPPTGYHCVMVTKYQGTPEKTNKGLPWFYLSNGSKKYVTGYMGYKSNSPSQGGESINGWWSDQMSRLVECGNGERYKDFAHEAGHMMGLADDEDNGIMTHTKCLNAKPTQANIEKVVENICGANVCSNEYC